VKNLYPFFCYYGGKWRVGKRYPAPTKKTIIEPFAGAAGYSIRHHNLDVKLYDVDETICGLWDYLIKSSETEIRNLPTEVKHVDDHKIPQEAKWLIGFWLNKGTTRPNPTPSSWMRSGLRPNSFWGEAIKERIATQVKEIKHWEIHNSSYENCPDVDATWFVDPPYMGDCGRYYRHRLDEYEKLAKWCQSRQGQTIVCERKGADWLPFKPFAKIKSTPGSRGKSYSSEVIWENPKKSD